MFIQNFVWILIGYLLAEGQGSAAEPDNQGDLTAAEADNPFNGDFLVRTEKHAGAPITRLNPQGQSVEVVATNTLYYAQDNQGNLAAGSEEPTLKPIYDQDGNVIGQEVIPSDDETVTDNTIYGTAGKDKINGLTGQDALSGGAGNDAIKGGDGNDYISSNANIQAGRQAYGPLDR